MERRRSPLVSIPPFGGDFQGMGSFDPMEVGRRKNAPVHRLDEPTGIALGMVAPPAVPASVSPGKIILAPQRPAGSQHPMARDSAKNQTRPDPTRPDQTRIVSVIA